MGQEQLQASPSLRLQGGSMPLITLSTAAWRAWMTFFWPAVLPCRFPVTSNFLLAFFLSSNGLSFLGAGLAFAGGSPFFFAMPVNHKNYITLSSALSAFTFGLLQAF